MREAKRLFSKPKDKETSNNPSPFFKSKLQRDLPNQSGRNSVGPGQYNISLPIVKPKFEAIRKNNHTIIVKINQKLSPAFQSLEPRFKDLKKPGPSQSKTLEPPQPDLQNQPGHNALHNKQIEQSMMNRIKRLSQILSQEEQQTAKRQVAASFSGSSTDQLQKIQGSEQTINSLKLYKKQRERLHFLLKQIRPQKITKGVGWSKYRETKGNLYRVNNVPGPGSYQDTYLSSTRSRYFETIDEKSWQFKSLTRRGYYENSEEKSYEVLPSRNRFISDINGKFYKVDSIPLLHEKGEEDKMETDPQQL